MNEDFKAALRRKGSFAQTAQAVAWSFFGVRKASDQDKDLSRINPVHVIVAGVLGALLLVAGLALLVGWIVGSGVAA